MRVQASARRMRVQASAKSAQRLIELVPVSSSSMADVALPDRLNYLRFYRTCR
jgi:hypothetical protein